MERSLAIRLHVDRITHHPFAGYRDAAKESN